MLETRRTNRNIKLNLSHRERVILRQKKIRIADLPEYPAAVLHRLLGGDPERARELRALADFQQVPSIGIAFATDLFEMGFDSLERLKGQDGALLTDSFERMKGYRTDPCVEDQFRLAVYAATTGDLSRKWWDFTAERKAYRKAHGYPVNRPNRTWYEARK